ncbi:hypothetical protein C8F01DRAFT_1233451 [Mycena amicta]|nr:hypothetical protein C8F01DRAFT_1233451 [Mycena amicta]
MSQRRIAAESPGTLRDASERYEDSSYRSQSSAESRVSRRRGPKRQRKRGARTEPPPRVEPDPPLVVLGPTLVAPGAAEPPTTPPLGLDDDPRVAGNARATVFYGRRSKAKAKTNPDPDGDSTGEGDSSGAPPKWTEPAQRVRNIPAGRGSEHFWNDWEPSQVMSDDDVDADLPDPPSSPEQTYKSPAKRAIAKSAPKNIKVLVIKWDVNGGACLLTRVIDPASSRQAAHIVARHTDGVTLTNLEWWWGLRYRSLYIDSRYNILLLRADWHISLDSDHWVLVPHHRHINKLAEWRSSFSKNASNLEQRGDISENYDTDDEIFEYFLLPLTKEMAHTVIPRYETVNKPSTVQLFQHPFKKFPVLKSRARPHFVVLSAGMKLAHQLARLGPGEQTARLRKLAKVANFGHRGKKADVENSNVETLSELIDAYTQWSSEPRVIRAVVDVWKKTRS